MEGLTSTKASMMGGLGATPIHDIFNNHYEERIKHDKEKDYK